MGSQGMTEMADIISESRRHAVVQNAQKETGRPAERVPQKDVDWRAEA